MQARAFTDEREPPEDGGSGESQGPEYSFEGFTVEFSEKIMLTSPAAENAPRKGKVAS